MNRTPQKSWIEFRSSGRRQPRRHRRARDESTPRQDAGPAGPGRRRYLSQSFETLHFASATWSAVDGCDISWPSGAKQHLEHPAINRLNEVTSRTEDAGRAARTPRSRSSRSARRVGRHVATPGPKRARRISLHHLVAPRFGRRRLGIGPRSTRRIGRRLPQSSGPIRRAPFCRSRERRSFALR